MIAVAALVSVIGLASGAAAHAPVTADWRLVALPDDRESVFVADQTSLRQRKDGKQVQVAIIYRDSAIAAVEMTLVVDCARNREKVSAVKLHDSTGRVFPQPVSKRFEPSEPDGPWRRYFCAANASPAVPVRLGPQFPDLAARKLLEDAPSPSASSGHGQ